MGFCSGRKQSFVCAAKSLYLYSAQAIRAAQILTLAKVFCTARYSGWCTFLGAATNPFIALASAAVY